MKNTTVKDVCVFLLGVGMSHEHVRFFTVIAMVSCIARHAGIYMKSRIFDVRNGHGHVHGPVPA